MCIRDRFACDVFVFVASRGIPPVGSQVKDVRMAQFENNAAMVKQYARMARAADFQGLWCAVSDPVDPLAKTAYLESNRDENGVWDGKGLRPEQIQGFGLGVMNARAAYFAKRDPRLASFLTEGRSFGPVSYTHLLLPGINHILPYAVPPFAKECGEEAVFQLSRCCLESARDVIGTLEREYRALYGRNLTLGRLAEAVILPLCPDKRCV